jgi:diguanylate cyclase (GGDEF)-like protein
MYGCFAAVLFPLFHFILQAMPGVRAHSDSLLLRLCASACSISAMMAVRTVPALRRRAADVQFVHGIGLLLVSTALVVNSGSHFAYVAADFIVIMSAQQAVFRVRHLLTVFALAFTFQLACSALRGDFWEPMNLAAIGIFGCGYLLAAIPAIRRIQLQDREIRLRLEAQRVKAALVRLVCFDAFTGLQNRTALQQCLQEFIEAARATGEPFAVLFIDLDRFKEINDTLGHGIGDQVLRAVSRRCEKIVEPRGVLARWGGDEFIALVRGRRRSSTTSSSGSWRRSRNRLGSTNMSYG